MVVMPAVAVLMRPTVRRPSCLWSRYQFASVMTIVVSPPPGVSRRRLRSRWLAGVIVVLADLVAAGATVTVAMVMLKPAVRFGLILALPANVKNVPPAVALSTM